MRPRTGWSSTWTTTVQAYRPSKPRAFSSPSSPPSPAAPGSAFPSVTASWWASAARSSSYGASWAAHFSAFGSALRMDEPRLAGALACNLRDAVIDLAGRDAVKRSLEGVPEVRRQFEEALPLGWVPITLMETAFERIAATLGRD